MKRLILLAALLCGARCAEAHDFVVTLDGQKVYFNIKSQKNRTAEVTYNGSIAGGQPTDYEGELTIPARVKHDDQIYTVVGVGAKAFSGAERLTGVVFPLGITSIGDFAFEGCTSLSKIIFPGNAVKFGQGVFFKCDKIQDLSFGSEWREVDLRMFRWSDSLRVITFPAKLERIQNLKSLKQLERVVVDVNNARFTTVDGVLYNKSGEILYGCPRAYRGKLQIAEGVKRVTPGALIDCVLLEQVDLPASLEQISFREFSRMPLLRAILFRAAQPVMTAKADGRDCFVLQVQHPDVALVVLKQARDAYREALVQQSGQYTERDGSIPYLVEQAKMPAARQLVAVKDFSKYE